MVLLASNDEKPTGKEKHPESRCSEETYYDGVTEVYS